MRGGTIKKLEPWLPQQRAVREAGLPAFWADYAELLAARPRPSAAERQRLAAAFNHLFATETGYRALDERIVLTRAKQAALLRVLDHPERPLHNNPAALGARSPPTPSSDEPPQLALLPPLNNLADTRGRFGRGVGGADP